MYLLRNNLISVDNDLIVVENDSISSLVKKSKGTADEAISVYFNRFIGHGQRNVL